MSARTFGTGPKVGTCRPGNFQLDITAADVADLVRSAGAADALHADPELRAEALRVMKRGIGEVLVWGDSWPEGLERGLDPVEHELSAAARAFKGYALIAIGLSEPVGPTETFRGRVSVRAAYSDLTPSVATSLAQR